MKKNMQKFLFFPLLFVNVLFGEIAEWQREQLEKELEMIDLKNFSPANIWNSFIEIAEKNNGSEFKINHVKITPDQTIFINGELLEEVEIYPSSSSEAIRLAGMMRQLRNLYLLPECSFLYTRNAESILHYDQIKFVPVLVGSKIIDLLNNQISFIEEYTFGEIGQYESVINEVRKFNLPWENKLAKLVWRGSLNDEISLTSPPIYPRCFSFLFPDGSSDLLSPRFIIHILSFLYTDLINARLTYIHRPFLYKAEKHPNFFDLSNLSSNLYFYTGMNYEEKLKYRYQIVLDGVHATNPGYAWRLFSNSCVFKQDSPYHQWFFSGLKPNIHFIPVKRDLSDLIEKIQSAICNDSQSEFIAKQAKEFAENHLQPCHFFEHAYHVLLEYSHKQQEAQNL